MDNFPFKKSLWRKRKTETRYCCDGKCMQNLHCPHIDDDDNDLTLMKVAACAILGVAACAFGVLALSILALWLR